MPPLPCMPQPCFLWIILWRCKILHDDMRTSTHWDSQFITPAKTALRKFWCRLPTRGCLSRLAQTWTVSPKQPQNYRDQCLNCQFPLKGKIYCFISPFPPGFDRQIIDISLYRLTRAWVVPLSRNACLHTCNTEQICQTQSTQWQAEYLS